MPKVKQKQCNDMSSGGDFVAALSVSEFSDILARGFTKLLGKCTSVAVGVSGGPDSMALCKLLSDWSSSLDCSLEIHVLSVDHGLRKQAAQEAALVHEIVSKWPHITHSVLRWEGDKPDTRIQEEARGARYGLMAAYCERHAIKHLFLAHHQDDQAETFLFRLAKGSGLDGLAAMMPAQDYSPSLALLRPLLEVPKTRLIATCVENDVSFVEDPSNDSDKYARVRLRKSRDVLKEEGLTSKRLSTTAMRLARARQALDQISDMAMQDITIQKDTKRIALNLEVLKAWPGEIGLRVLIKSMADLNDSDGYGPRMEKVESLFEALMVSPEFRRQTLGGCIIQRDDGASQLIIELETAQ